MSPITFHSDWVSFDTLDGQELREGEHLRIEWPNGDRTEDTGKRFTVLAERIA